MKIGILTQPLLNNYGGTLQNYALQFVLRKLGHEPVTIDYNPKSSVLRYLLSCMKTIIYFFIPSKRRSFSVHPRRKYRNSKFERFTRENITLTKMVGHPTDSIIKSYGIKAIIVGSDQVWRPKYNHHLQDMFLSFVRNPKINKLSYASSFGTDNWEFSDAQTVMILPFIKKFSAVSVRELSAVRMCKQYLGVDAIQVLDPTLLLDVSEYMKICRMIPQEDKDFIFAYILDMTIDKKEVIEKAGKELGIPIQYHTAETKAELSVEEWIAKFRDTSYIITDSFHGTVFSIIFGKPFKSLFNENRGTSRFESLLNLYNSGMIEKKKIESIDFLKKNLL